MKEFFQRAMLFALVNAVIIGTCFLFNRNAAMPDYNIIYGTLVSLILGLPYEIVTARKSDRRPDISGGWGAAIVGTLVMAAIIFVILLVAGVIV